MFINLALLGTVFSSLIATNVYAQNDTIRFHNVSNQPILIAFAYTKDESVAGLGNSAYYDPNPVLHTTGYHTVKGQSSYDIPKFANVDMYGKTMRPYLTAVRVIVADGNKQAIVHPDKGSPIYYPIYSKPGNSNFRWSLNTIDQTAVDRRVKELANQGREISVGMFYSLYHWENRNPNGQKWHGVGAGGSDADTVIRRFWAENADNAGTLIKLTNGTGRKQEFRVSFQTTDGNWQTFKNIADVQPGGEWSLRAGSEHAIAKDGSGYQIKVEGKDFDDRNTTWGPPLNLGEQNQTIDGKRTKILNGRLN